MARQEYTTDFISIPNEGIQQESHCADISFYNYGGATLIINDVISLATNQFITIAGNTGELDVSKYRTRFSGAGSRIGVIVRRMYKS